MILINNLFGPFNAETSEGRGANAAHNVVKYINEGKKIAQEKLQQFMKGEINLQQTARNEALETLAQAYIPYMPVDEETGSPDLKYGLAFASEYLKAFDSDNDGCITPQEAGPLGDVVDFTAPYGKITPGKFLSWLMYQDCTEIYNGVISPKEAMMAMMTIQKDPLLAKEQISKLYFSHKINELEQEFVSKITQ